MSSTRVWSQQQEAIFSWFASSTGHLVVRARAGTGKTTTIIEAVGRAPESRILLAAFNKRIADELTRKLIAERCEAKTLHSVGYAALRRYWSTARVDSNRGATLAQRAAGYDAPDAMVTLVRKVAAYGKNCAPIAALEPDGIDVLADLAERFDCEPDEEWSEDGWTTERVAACAQRAMRLALERDGSGSVDFDDMIFVPLANRWIKASYDLVVVDEAQDMNAAQILLAQRSCRGRICVVGDDRQAIYGFRGADSGSIDRLKNELRAAELGLTITYRCPRSVVALAAELVPDYTAASTAPDGAVVTVTNAEIATLAQPGDYVLSRKNAPLMGLCLALLRQGKRARIECRDIGRGLVSLVKKLKAKSMPELLRKLESWQDREIKRSSSSRYAEEKQARIQDEADTIRELSVGLSGPRELEARIESLFDDTAPGVLAAVVCSSIHRAKGLEARRVFVLMDTLYPRGKSIEERNLHYVAITRAQSELYLAYELPLTAAAVTKETV